MSRDFLYQKTILKTCILVLCITFFWGGGIGLFWTEIVWIRSRSLTTQAKIWLSKLQFLDNFYLVTVTKNCNGDKIVERTKNNCYLNRYGTVVVCRGTKCDCQCHRYLLQWRSTLFFFAGRIYSDTYMSPHNTKVRSFIIKWWTHYKARKCRVSI